MKIIHHSNRIYQLLKNCIGPAFAYLRQGYRANLVKAHCVSFAKHLFRHLQSFGVTLDKEYRDLGDLHGPRMQKLRTLTAGLHALLPKQAQFSYSILIPLYFQPSPELFRKTLLSALQQTAPHLEILIGYAHHCLSKEIEKMIKEFQDAFPQRLSIFAYSTSASHDILNSLAQEAKGHFLFVLDPYDWLRPDFLFRCEQLLRLLKGRENVCLYTDEYEINEGDHPIPGKQIQKPHRIAFPYLFYNALGRSLLIPRHLWELAGGMQAVQKDKMIWDLALRLDRVGATFRHLPFYLYAKRNSLHHSLSSEPVGSFEEQLSAYTQAEQLSWKWSAGDLPNSYRAVPELKRIPKVQVIIPYKDQKDLTLKTIRSILKQKHVHVFVTAVDNASHDTSIAEHIKELGGEVISVHEPFNYSRLNNLAVMKTNTAQDCDSLLFLNNDVELKEEALSEMCRWVDQPLIGMVGCQLFYPNGLLQHGGIDRKRDAPATQMIWNHSEKMASHERQVMTKVLRLTDAVTAACALMKRKLFIEIGGFDEIWYPIAYSDTNLAVKVEAKGLYCLYTPYAQGVHHESVTRKYENIEDVEMSHWLHQQYVEQQLKNLEELQIPKR